MQHELKNQDNCVLITELRKIAKSKAEDINPYKRSVFQWDEIMEYVSLNIEEVLTPLDETSWKWQNGDKMVLSKKYLITYSIMFVDYRLKKVIV